MTQPNQPRPLTVGDIEIFAPRPDHILSRWVIQVAHVFSADDGTPLIVEWIAFEATGIDEGGLWLDDSSELPVVDPRATTLPLLPVKRAMIRFSRKWDGCTNVLVDQGSWAHFCDPEDIQDFAKVLLRLDEISRGMVTL